jgi:hypothetical protein
VSDVALPLSIPEVALAIEGAHARRQAAGQRLFQFLIDLEDVDLRKETIQRRLFDSDARDATLVVVAEVHSLVFTRAATSLAEALSGALADLEYVLPAATVAVITIEQAITAPWDR